MEFIKKNFITVLVVGATVVLAGVAVFTSLRLYSLRDNSITPINPELSGASEAPVGIRPSSGNWDLPEMFIVTNTSDEDVELVWQIDCWDETICEDTEGSIVLSPGQSTEEGLGILCSQWQLDLNWSGTATAENEIWDWAGVSQLGAECDFDIEEEQDSDEEVVDEAETQEAATQVQEDEVPAAAADYEITQCTVLSFTTGATPAPTASATPTATVEATPTATATAASTATPAPTATADAELPEAGIGLPTMIGIGFGALLLISAIGLAL